MAITVNIPHTIDNSHVDGFEGTFLDIECESGYTFVDAPTATYTPDMGFDDVTVSLTLNDENTKATATLTDNTYNDVVVNGETTGGSTPEPSDPTVKNDVKNTTEEHTYTDGNLSVTVNAVGSNKIKNVSVAYISGGFQMSSELTVSSNGTQATGRLNDVDTDTEVTLSGMCSEVSETEVYLTNCTMDGIKPYYFADETVNVTLTANAGTVFKSDEDTPHAEYSKDESGLIVTEQKIFTISENGTKATLTLNMSDVAIGFSITFRGGAVVSEPIGKNYGSINVYVVNDATLDAFAKKRFIAGSGTDSENIDLGRYVNSLKRVYADISTGANDVIKCGNYNTEIPTETPKDEFLTLDFGSVEIPDHNNDTTAYQSEIKIFLPFVGMVNLPNDYVGKSVNLEYVIQVVNGDGIAKLSCDGTVFMTQEITPYDDVLYLTANDKIIGGDKWNANRLMGAQPYIYEKWYTGKDSGNNNDRKTAKLSTLNGYYIFDYIEPIQTGKMLTVEQETIYRLLRQGVYL